MKRGKSSSLIQCGQKHPGNPSVVILLFKGHWHLHNNNASPSRQMMILFWNHTILHKTKAKRFVQYTRLFTTAGTIIACELQPVLKTDSKQVVFILELLLNWAGSSLQSKHRGGSCAHLRLGHWNMSQLEILQWKKENETTMKNKPSFTMSHGFCPAPL